MDKNTTVKVNLTSIVWQNPSESKPAALLFDVRAIFLYDFSSSTPELLPLADCKDIMKAYVLDETGDAAEDFIIEIAA